MKKRERIEVSPDWRLMQCDTTFKMVFTEGADTERAYEAIVEVIESFNFEDGYADIWLQDLGDSRSENSFDIISKLWCDEFAQYIPAMAKAIAKALPTSCFSGYGCHDSLKCFYVHEFEFEYNHRDLKIKETFMDDDYGYFCPECGFQIELPYAEFEDEEIECEDCGKTFKVADLKYVPPVIREETITF